MIKTKDEFKQYIRDNIKSYLPDNYQDATINFETFTKKGKTIEGMLIGNEEQKIVPRISINGVYDSYSMNENLDIAMNELASIVEHSQTEAEKINLTKMTDNITIKIVSLDQNRELTKVAPHKIKDDMLITYQWIANINEGGFHSALVRNEMMGSIGLDTDELHRIALKNTERIFPPVIGDIQHMIFEESVPLEEFIIEEKGLRLPMYVITNKIMVNGAATIFYPGVMENLAEKFGRNIYILPSSVHEIILMPDDENIDIRSLEDIVRSVNQDQVEPEDRLSNHVFLYDKDNKCLVRANNQGIDMNQEFANFFLNQNSGFDVGYSYDDQEFEP